MGKLTKFLDNTKLYNDKVIIEKTWRQLLERFSVNSTDEEWENIEVFFKQFFLPLLDGDRIEKGIEDRKHYAAEKLVEIIQKLTSQYVSVGDYKIPNDDFIPKYTLFHMNKLLKTCLNMELVQDMTSYHDAFKDCMLIISEAINLEIGNAHKNSSLV